MIQNELLVSYLACIQISILCLSAVGMTQGIRENFAHYKNVTDEKTIKEVSRIALKLQQAIFIR